MPWRPAAAPGAFRPPPTTPPSCAPPSSCGRPAPTRADQAGTAPVVPMVRPRPRGRMALVSVAAGLALVGATVAATENIDHPASTRAALPLPRARLAPAALVTSQPSLVTRIGPVRV